MRLVLAITMLFVCSFADGQIVKKFFKWSTVYASGNVGQPIQGDLKQWYVTQNGDVHQITPIHPFNYDISLGIRKMARFDYELKPNIFYDGSESNVGGKTNVGAVNGFEYVFERSWQRQWGHQFTNQSYFIRYFGKRFVAHVKYLEEGAVDLNYGQIDLRYRQAIGNKINLTIGGVIRTHGPYGINPIEDYLEEKAWWDLAYHYGFSDQSYTIIDYTNACTHDPVCPGGHPPDTTVDWSWKDPVGQKIASTDEEFRTYYYGAIVNQYNDSVLNDIGPMMTSSLAIGVDFYHHSEKFWVHSWVNVMPFHRHLFGDPYFSYGAFISREEGSNTDQWVDYNVGLIVGAKITKRLGLFFEGDYLRYWDKSVYSAKGGINFIFR